MIHNVFFIQKRGRAMIRWYYDLCFRYQITISSVTFIHMYNDTEQAYFF